MNDVDAPSSLIRSRPGAFRLVRYFMLTSLVAFSVVGVVLYLLQRGEEVFFARVQDEQVRFFADVQKALATQQQRDAERGLLAVHEAGHVNLTRLFANVLWAPFFAPFVAQSQSVAVEPCRDLPSSGTAPAPSARQACFAKLGERLQSLPGFAGIDERAHAMMRNTTVFKIKVFDLRGVTVYSSDHAQIGEDKSDNAGWQSAVKGVPASELTHRDRFSAFEGVVENRDLISSYVPVRAPGADEIVGVFEIYSDVTPLLAELRAASARIEQLTAANQQQVEVAARQNEAKVTSSSGEFLAIVGGLLALLYVALLLVVRHGQRIIDTQAEEQERAAAREHLWHREKMATLAALAANVSHEVGNALSVISGHAREVADAQARGEQPQLQPEMILEHTYRVGNMTRRIADFASAQSDRPEPVDLNQIAGAVCDILKFDRRFRNTPLEFRSTDVPLIVLAVPDHLNEALINAVESFARADGATGSAGARLVVTAAARNDAAVLRLQASDTVAGGGTARDVLRDAKLDVTRRRVQEMGGGVVDETGAVEISLPLDRPREEGAKRGIAAPAPAFDSAAE